MKEHPAWALEHKRAGTELRCIRGKYYLYEVSSVYDKKKKRAKKISGKYLGSISEEKGFIASGKIELRKKAERQIQPSEIAVREYGFTAFLEQFNTPVKTALENNFSGLSEHIIYMAYCRLLYNSPIKNMPFHIAKSMLSVGEKTSLSDKYFSSLLRKIGQMRQNITAYMKSFMRQNDYVLVDMTNIFTNSEQMRYAKEGYNSDMIFDKQFNLLYIYSSSLVQPLFYRLYTGNIREVRAFRLCLQESGIKDAVIIMDKGFYSKENIEMILNEHLSYIIPLRRDNQLLNYELLDSKSLPYFKYEGRYIWYTEFTIQEDKQKVFFYLDDQLKVQEKKDYLDRIVALPEYYTIEKFRQKQERFGSIALMSNLQDADAEQIFTIYKSRNNVEVMFDGIKNVLHADRTYMQNEDALEGWMFINHIAIQWYYIIYQLLQQKNQLKRFSVRDFLIHLQELKKVKIQSNWVIEPMIKSSSLLFDKLGIHIT